MVDPVNGSGGAGAVTPPKNDALSEARDKKKAEDVQQAREADKVEISEAAQNLAQIEEIAKNTRAQLEQNEQALSGGRVDALV